MTCRNNQCNQGRTCPARLPAPTGGTLTLRTSTMPRADIKRIRLMMDKAGNQMTVGRARRELVPGALDVVVNTMTATAVTVAVGFLFVPVLLLVPFVAVLTPLVSYTEQRRWAERLPTECEGDWLEVVE